MFAKGFFKAPYRIEAIAATGSSAAINAVLWVLALTLFPNSDVTVLHYNVNTGIDLIGSGKQIMVLPTIGGALLIGSAILISTLRRMSPQSAWIIVGSLPVIQLILLASFFLVWQANR